MRKLTLILIFCFVFSGCVSLQKLTVPKDMPEEAVEIEKESPAELLELPDSSQEPESIEKEELEEVVKERGVVFAKTDFQGLLETRYVKFLFEDLDDPTHKFQLHIGESSEQQTFPWDVKNVKPGYFFVELPVGRYKIVSISIPVGSTTATEDMDVILEVVSDTICYVGTLKMIGTKEKIKLGGLPVIKPGFEYTVEVLDEQEEGMEAFRKNYPDYPHDVFVKLMQVNELSPNKN